MTTFALSTSWYHNNEVKVSERIEQMMKAGFTRIELGFSLSARDVHEYMKAVNQQKIQVVSVHNVCPVPDGFSAGAFFPDHFSLASPNEEERAQAVSLAAQSLQTARNAGARALVLHAGRVDIPDRTPQLRTAAQQEGIQASTYQHLLAQIFEEREQAKPPFWNAIIRSLDELLPIAEETGIIIGLETRYYYREIPSLDEFGQIFEQFGQNPYLRYWHDVGHAQVREYLGFGSQWEYLDRYGHLLAGVHLHDTIRARDHKFPGSGEFDFNAIRDILNKDIIRVIEVHPPVTHTELSEARRFLERITSLEHKGESRYGT